MFKDEVTISIRSGKGGDGCISFRREKFVARGGPDGGDGGKGGDVVFVTAANIPSLGRYHNNQKFSAQDGRQGGGSRCTGRSGEDLVLEVPQGTIIRDAERGHLLRDLSDSNQPFIMLKGGQGGRGNARFATSVNQAPRRADDGRSGEERQIILEVKMIADIGIVGLPNAGKSTFLSRVTKATPQIADYPFTTLIPQLGVCELNYHRFIFADIPGLIEGAHQGLGLGHKFLKHVERTQVLLHLIDCQEGLDKGFTAVHATIKDEMKNYSHLLANKPQVVAISKADLLYEQLDVNKIAEELQTPVFLISSHSGHGLKPLLHALLRELGIG